MATVSNTSPLLNLAILGELELIRTQFDSVLVPPAVVDEFQLETGRPGSRHSNAHWTANGST